MASDSEYFTEGNIVSKGGQIDGFVYKNSWIYVEYQNYQRYIKTLSSGEKVYADDNVQRIVKLNTLTGKVSSVCLDPLCTHSPGSDCIMMAPQNSIASIDAIVGDWLVFSYHMNGFDIEGFWPTVYAYNMRTGELCELYDYDFSGTVINRMSLRCVFENKLYYTKTTLDYSDTDYDPSEDIPLSEYEPKTRTMFWEYDFETKKHKELFEVPEFYKISAVTNKRFFFILQQGDVFSCDHDGSNRKKEENFNFAVSTFCGNYAYYFDSLENIMYIYDVATDTAKIIPYEYSYQQCILTDEGIMYSTFSKANEEFFEARKNFNARECLRLRYAGSAWIHLMDFDGGEYMRIYENDKLGVTVSCVSEKYFCGNVSYYDPEAYKSHSYLGSERHLIDRQTGEILPVPLLELVLVEE